MTPKYRRHVPRSYARFRGQLRKESKRHMAEMRKIMGRDPYRKKRKK